MLYIDIKCIISETILVTIIVLYINTNIGDERIQDVIFLSLYFEKCENQNNKIYIEQKLTSSK